MSKLTPTQRAKRKERASSIHVDIAPYMGKSVTAVQLLNAGNHHYRLIGPRGGMLDYWPSTTRWSVFRSPEIRGQGLKRAMELLEGLESPAQQTKRGGDLTRSVTIFCDGSYDKGVGGWGCWIKKDGIEAVTRGGPFTAGIGSAQDAEVRAMANSLWLAVHRGIAEPGDTVMIQTDCVAVLAALLKLVPGAVYSRGAEQSVNVSPPRRLQKTLKESEALAGAVRLIVKNRFKVILRHVKGHQAKTSSGRAWVNALTDKLAREGLNAARERQKVSNA